MAPRLTRLIALLAALSVSSAAQCVSVCIASGCGSSQQAATDSSRPNHSPSATHHAGSMHHGTEMTAHTAPASDKQHPTGDTDNAGHTPGHHSDSSTCTAHAPATFAAPNGPSAQLPGYDAGGVDLEQPAWTPVAFGAVSFGAALDHPTESPPRQSVLISSIVLRI